ncbi:MAG: hypothetical protein AB1742_13510 [bacterium]
MKTPPNEKITLFRGTAAEIHPSLGKILFIDDLVNYVFHVPYPPLVSAVALRYNLREAVRRYERDAGTPRAGELMSEHYSGNREYSVFVSATSKEEEAAFFAGNPSGQHGWGLVVRFNYEGYYEEYTPGVNVGGYGEILVVGGVRPEMIDKITLIGAGTNAPFTVHHIYRRLADGSVKKFLPSNSAGFEHLNGWRWRPETMFTRAK